MIRKRPVPSGQGITMPDIQTIVVLACVAGAVLYLGWRGWRLFHARSQSACGDCGDNCASRGESPPERQLVTEDEIEVIRR